MKRWFFRKFVFRTAKGIAKRQLRAFYALRNKFPNMSNEELYYCVIRTRPKYTEEMANQIIEIAKQEGEPLQFRDVVHALVMEETPMELDSIVRSPTESRYNFNSDSELNEKTFTTYYEIVDSIIPPDIYRTYAKSIDIIVEKQ